MREIRPGIIEISDEEAVLIVARRSPQRALPQGPEVPGVLRAIREHFTKTSRALEESMGGSPDDEEALRTAIDPGFVDLSPAIRRLNISDEQIKAAVRQALQRSLVDSSSLNIVAEDMGREYLKALRSYEASITPRTPGAA